MKKIYVVKEKNCYGVKKETYFTSKDKCIGFILGKINGHKKACSLKNDKWDYENKYLNKKDLFDWAFYDSHNQYFIVSTIIVY